jgi:hypothetical protein
VESQDAGTGQLWHNWGQEQHQMFSTYWVEHIQRAARAEMALSIRRAALAAQREALLRWHTQQVVTSTPYPALLLLDSNNGT